MPFGSFPPASAARSRMRRRRSVLSWQISELFMASHRPVKSGRLLLVRATHHVLNDEAQRRFLCNPFQIDHLDDVAEPALQPGLNGRLQRRPKLETVRRKDHLTQAAAEVWTIDAL